MAAVLKSRFCSLFIAWNNSYDDIITYGHCPTFTYKKKTQASITGKKHLKKATFGHISSPFYSEKTLNEFFHCFRSANFLIKNS